MSVLKEQFRDVNILGKERGAAGLEHLFGSKTRVKLLTIFLHYPEENFYVRELVRRVGMQIHSVRRELANLCNLGIVTSSGGDRTKGVALSLRKRYYKANRDFLLYQELQSLVGKAQVMMERNLVQKIMQIGDIDYIALCGIFVGEKSQTDMLIVGKISQTALEKIIRRFEHEVGHGVNYTLMTTSEFQNRRNITDRFLYSIIEGKKIVTVDQLGWHV